MRILHIASGDFFSTYGGGQVYVKNIIDEMICQGVDVCVVSFVSHHAELKRLSYQGQPLYEIGSGCDEQIAEAVRELRPDIIHAHSHKSEVCLLGRALHVPVIVTAHHGGILCPAGTLLDNDDTICSKQVCVKNCLRCCLRNIRSGLYWYPLVKHLPEGLFLKLGQFLRKKPFIPFITPIGGTVLAIEGKRAQWKCICEQCTLMIAPSEVMGKAMTDRGLDERKLRVVPHGIPRPKSVPPAAPVTDGVVKLFYIGRICYVKGIHVLLEAFAGVRNNRVELHLIGGAANKAEVRYMQRLQKKYAHDTRIIWHGKVNPEAVYEQIKEYHASSSSSFLESFGLNISESLAMGKPVIATRCGGAEMQIKEGINGWLVPTNDPEALRAKIEEVVRHPDRLSSMSERCKQSVVYLEEHCKVLNKIYSEYDEKKETANRR